MINNSRERLQPWHTPWLIGFHSELTVPTFTASHFILYKLYTAVVTWSGGQFCWGTSRKISSYFSVNSTERFSWNLLRDTRGLYREFFLKWQFTSIYEVSQMKTLNMFYLVIYWTQKVHNDFIFLCSIVLPPVGHPSNHEYHCWNLQDNRAVVRIFIALLRFSCDSPSYITCTYHTKNISLARPVCNTARPRVTEYCDVGTLSLGLVLLLRLR